MSCDVVEDNNLKKCGKKSWLSKFFCTTIFGCLAKKSHIKPFGKSYACAAVQCEIGNELEETNFFAARKILVESKAKLDITLVDNDIYPRKEEFKHSLKKIDDLINTLNEIQAVYKNKTLSCNELIFNPKSVVGDTENNKNILNFNDNEHYLKLLPEVDSPSEEEILNFNINFDENTFIQCHTNRGKHSLKIIGHKNFNPLILHRCESELVLTKTAEQTCKSQIWNRTSSIELSYQEAHQLQRSYHTLPARRFSSILNLSSLKSNIIEHMKNIKDDVKTLKSILCTIECLITKEDRPNLPLYFEEIKKWFSEKENDVKRNIKADVSGGDLVKLEESRYIEAKIRATNFCKFYNLTKLNKAKSKVKKYIKN